MLSLKSSFSSNDSYRKEGLLAVFHQKNLLKLVFEKKGEND